MNKDNKVLDDVLIPEFEESIANMPAEDRMFIDKGMEIVNYIFTLLEERGMQQKDLAAKLGKSEAEISKWLTGMHNFTLRSLCKVAVALDDEILYIPKEYKDVKIKKHYKIVTITNVVGNTIEQVGGRREFERIISDFKERQEEIYDDNIFANAS